MRIANVMFGRGLGGIEQAFLDYNEALLLAGYEVLAITHPLAEINSHITGELTHHMLANYGNYDLFAARRLRQFYHKWQPELLISHGNRALNLNHRARGACAHHVQHIAVTHNYQVKHFDKLDAAFATTTELAEVAHKAAPKLPEIPLIPNMIRLSSLLKEPENSLPIIGALGRMVPKKGFHLLLEAAALLQERGVSFALHIGGGGDEEAALRQQVQSLGLEEKVTFLGWVEDKAAFYKALDIFCLPSTHEPFGIVLLEAMNFGRPVVGFATEGPSDIIRKQEAVLVPNHDVKALADALQALLADEKQQAEMITAGRKLVEEKYTLPVVSRKIDHALKALRQNTISAA